MKRRSEEFEKIIELQKKGVPGFITKATEEEMLEYMRRLEWVNEELEGHIYHCKNKRSKRGCRVIQV